MVILIDPDVEILLQKRKCGAVAVLIQSSLLTVLCHAAIEALNDPRLVIFEGNLSLLIFVAQFHFACVLITTVPFVFSTQ